MKNKKCSYCKRSLGKIFSFNPFTTVTVYKCRRRWCTFLKKIGIFRVEITLTTSEAIDGSLL